MEGIWFRVARQFTLLLPVGTNTCVLQTTLSRDLQRQ
jgi:hypothetical protein